MRAVSFRVVVEDWPGWPHPNRMAIRTEVLRLRRLRHGRKT